MGANSSILITIGAKAADAISEFNRLDRAIGEHLTKTQKVQQAVQKAAVPAAIALAAVGYAALDATKAAAEDAEAQEKLAGVLRRVTGANEATVASVEDYITATSQAVGVSDDELRPALSKLATATGDVSKAQSLLGTALDISAQTGKPLEAVSTALSKAYAGNEGALKKLLPGIDEGILKSGDFAKIQEELARITGGAAQESANTAAGQFRRFGITIQETKEAIGAALLPILNAFLPILQRVATFAQNNSDVLVVLIGVIGGVAAAVVGINAAMSAWNAIQVVAKGATLALEAAQWLLNVALTANPIGVVIVAVAAFVAALVIAYNKSETFRNIVDAIGDAFRAAFNWVNDHVIPIIATFYNGFKTALNWIDDHAGPVLTALKLSLQMAFAPITLAISAMEKLIDLLGSWKKSSGANNLDKPLPNQGTNGILPPVKKGSVGINSMSVELSPSAQQFVDDEALARAISRLLLGSEVRNGLQVNYA